MLFIHCTRQDVHQNQGEIKNNSSSLRSENPYVNPCFDPQGNGCDPVESAFEKTITVPGYCDVKVTYSLYNCGGIYTISDLTWHFVSGQNCNDWLASVRSTCETHCMVPGPGGGLVVDPDCVLECIGDAYLQADVDIHWYVMSDYVMREHFATLGDCNDPNGSGVLSVRFFREQCKLVCHSNPDPAYFSPEDVVLYVCGGGCCEQGATYCKDSNGNLTTKDNYFDSQNVNCSGINHICEQLYNQTTVSDCKPATCN